MPGLGNPACLLTLAELRHGLLGESLLGLLAVCYFVHLVDGGRWCPLSSVGLRVSLDVRQETHFSLQQNGGWGLSRSLQVRLAACIQKDAGTFRGRPFFTF